ncbi:MAG TPA: response regulator transcription factor [Rhizobiaceae bacterium]
MTDLAGPAGEDEGKAGACDWARCLFEPRKTILFVAADGIISDRLVHVLKLEFPGVEVEFVADVSSACRQFGHPVALILVDASMLGAAERFSRELLRLHPYALTAAIQRDKFARECSLPEILRFPSVRAILPMNVRLDIWLSVLRLMLCGGEYFPPEIMFARSGSPARAYLVPPGDGAARAGRQESDLRVTDLTSREIQVLEMAADGLQNKAIAADLGLSEHTVKVHLHNIISKLSVHNRTEAADKLRRFREANARFEG